jgi:hypothetical protein
MNSEDTTLADLIEIEDQLNGSQNVAINNLQDHEIKEAVKNIEKFLNYSIDYLKDNDYLFLCSTTAKYNSSTCDFSDTNSTIKSDMEFYFDIMALINLDLAKMGLKGGRLIELRSKDSENKSANSSPTSSLCAFNEHIKKAMDLSISETDLVNYTSVINLNFMLGIYLNAGKGLYKINKTNEINSYTISMTRKPSNWSDNDLHELTVPYINTNEKNYLKDTLDNSHMSTKAVLDRICKQVLSATKHEQEIFIRKNPQQKSKISIESCGVVGNQIQIIFVWKGAKFTRLEYHVAIQLGLEFNDADTSAHHSFLTSTLDRYLRTGKFSKHLPSNFHIDNVFQNTVSFSKTNFNLDLNKRYLSCSMGVKYWSLNLLPIKINLLKFISYITGLSTGSLAMKKLIHILNDDIDASSDSNSQLFPTNSKKTISYNFTLNNDNHFYVLVKLVQSLVCLGLNKDLNERYFVYGFQSQETLVVTLFLNEILKCDKPDAWQVHNCFDRIWSILSDFHALISTNLTESLNSFDKYRFDRTQIYSNDFMSYTKRMDFVLEVNTSCTHVLFGIEHATKYLIHSLEKLRHDRVEQQLTNDEYE